MPAAKGVIVDPSKYTTYRTAATAAAQNRTWRSRLTGPASWDFTGCVSWLQQIPFTAPGIEEHCDQPIRLAARRFKESDAARAHRCVIAPEVRGVKEKADPSPGLIAEASPLALIARNRKHDRRPCALRSGDHDPTFVGAERRVFKNREAEGVAEEGEALVIARDEKGDSGEALEHQLRPNGSYGSATGRYRRHPRPRLSRRPPIQGWSARAEDRDRRRELQARSPPARSVQPY